MIEVAGWLLGLLLGFGVRGMSDAGHEKSLTKYAEEHKLRHDAKKVTAVKKSNHRVSVSLSKFSLVFAKVKAYACVSHVALEDLLQQALMINGRPALSAMQRFNP